MAAEPKWHPGPAPWKAIVLVVALLALLRCGREGHHRQFERALISCPDVTEPNDLEGQSMVAGSFYGFDEPYDEMAKKNYGMKAMGLGAIGLQGIWSPMDLALSIGASTQPGVPKSLHESLTRVTRNCIACAWSSMCTS